MTAPALDITRGGARKPLAIDLFCGLFGWSDGFVKEGWDVIGFDLEDMHANFGLSRPPEFRLVIQNVLSLHGSQFRNADCIVASPPCQRYSWMAMPWSRAKAKAAAIRADATGKELEQLNRLFVACFRIQREACESAGRRIPLVVENVRGAQEWVGPARWNYGSFYLFGDVPALMPATFKARKLPGFRFDGSGRSFQSASVAETGIKAPGMNWSDQTKRGQDFTRIAGKHAAERDPMWKRGFTATAADQIADGIKCGGDWFGDDNPSAMRQHSSKSPKRKAASAMIAKIPEPLSRWIARCFLPRAEAAA